MNYTRIVIALLLVLVNISYAFSTEPTDAELLVVLNNRIDSLSGEIATLQNQINNQKDLETIYGSMVDTIMDTTNKIIGAVSLIVSIILGIVGYINFVRFKKLKEDLDKKSLAQSISFGKMSYNALLDTQNYDRALYQAIDLASLHANIDNQAEVRFWLTTSQDLINHLGKGKNQRIDYLQKNSSKVLDIFNAIYNNGDENAKNLLLEIKTNFSDLLKKQ